MHNLTQHLKVVGTEIAGIQILPGWHTVVLKQEKTGRVVKQHLHPGQKLNRGPFGGLLGTSDYISIPVTDNTRLRHEFNAPVDHVSPGHAFDAFYVLDFSVWSHQDVAIRWPDDPVRKVEHEILRVLNGITSTTNWDILKREILDDGAVAYFANDVEQSTDALQPYANGYGIQIDRIRMKLRLSKTDARPDETKADLERAKQIGQYEKEGKIFETLANHEVNLLKAHQNADVQTIEEWGKARAGAARHVDAALGHIAENTKTGAELARNVQVIASLSNGLGGAAAAYGSQPFPSTLPSLDSPRTGLLGAAGENKLATVVAQLAAVVDSLNGDRDQKRELASNLLHAVAESWREKKASQAELEKYLQASKQLIAGYSVTSEQFEALNKLADSRALQEMLK